MHTSLFTRNTLYLALAGALLLPITGFAQTIGSYAISATVTFESPLLGIGSQTVNISPVALSETVANGSNTVTSPSAQNTIFGIPIYSLTNISNSTSACDTSTCKGGSGSNSIGSVSLLGGLITINNLQDTMTVTVPGSGTINISTTATGTLGGSGWTPPPALSVNGTTVPVSGSITVPLLNLLGLPVGSTQATFKGTATLGNVIKTTPSQGTHETDVVILDLKGSVADSPLTGAYHFDLKLAGPYGICGPQWCASSS